MKNYQQSNPISGVQAVRGDPVKRVEFLYLSQEEILDLNLPLREVVDLVE